MQKNEDFWIPKINKENKPLYKEIVRAIRHDISTGTLRPGDKMPPQRELAWSLGVNPSTIAKSYELATQQNLISGEIGRGTFVRSGSSEAWLFRLNNKENDNDLTTISPQITHDIAVDALLPLASASSWGYIEVKEIIAMQEAIRQWDKLFFNDDYIVLTAGAHHALVTIADFLCGMNDVILCEEFTYPGLFSVQNIRPYRLQPVSMDRYGITPQALEAAIIRHRPKLLTLMSYNQNPTMINMPLQRQKEIAEIIKKYQLITIEDDVWGHFHDGSSLYEHMPEYVIRLNSFSKTIAGGFRLGWIRGYMSILDDIQKSPELSSWMIAPPLMRLVLHWLKNGYAQSLFQAQKKEIKQRFSLAQQILGLNNKNICCYLWLKTKEKGSIVTSQLLKENIKVAPAQIFSPLNTDAPFIRVSLLHSHNHEDLAYLLKKIRVFLI